MFYGLTYLCQKLVYHVAYCYAAFTCYMLDENEHIYEIFGDSNGIWRIMSVRFIYISKRRLLVHVYDEITILYP